MSSPEARLASVANALVDGLGHGTHVAGIIAGGLPEGDEFSKSVQNDRVRFAVFEQVFEADIDGDRLWATSDRSRVKVPHPEALHGVAPKCLLVSLKVLDEDGDGRVSDVIRALEYIREQINDDPKLLRVHGVNLSVGYEFDAEMFACGQSPLCAEVNRLVQGGVVVVAAAGNTGYGTVARRERAARRRPDQHHQRPRQRRARDHRRLHPPRRAAHLRGVVLLVEGPDRRRSSQAGPGGARRADHLLRRGRQARRGEGADGDGNGPPGRLLRGRQRHQHGRAPRLGRHRRVPLDPARVHRQARSRSSASSWRRRRRSAANGTSRATACST